MAQNDQAGHRERRPWTEEEDRLLRLGIEREDPGANPPTKWHAIANHVPNRTNKDCRKRWWAQMATTVAKGGWSADEDERLCNAVQEYGTKWALVAKHVQSRNSGQCAKRWNDALNPAIDRSEWTEEEDVALIEAVKVQGKSWTNIVRAHLAGRTGLAAKNRYNHLTRASSDRTKNRDRRTSAAAAAPYSTARTNSVVPPSSASTESTPPRSGRDSPAGSHSPYPHPGGMTLKKEEPNYALGYPRDARRDALALSHPADGGHLGYPGGHLGVPSGAGPGGMYAPMQGHYPYPSHAPPPPSQQQQQPLGSPHYGPGPSGGPSNYFPSGGPGGYHSASYGPGPQHQHQQQHQPQHLGEHGPGPYGGGPQHYLPPPNSQYGRYGPPGGYDGGAHAPGVKALDGYSRAQHALPPSSGGYDHRAPQGSGQGSAYDNQTSGAKGDVVGQQQQQIW